MKNEGHVLDTRPVNVAQTFTGPFSLVAAVAKRGKPKPLPHHRIELNLRDLNQLFNTMDPSPFHEKDLDEDAEEFIVSWVNEYHRHDPVTLVVHLSQFPEGPHPKEVIEKAVHHYFSHRAQLIQMEFKHLMKQGRMSLVIGFAFLGVCLLASELLNGLGGGTVSRLLQESLMIGGTVAMWRPMEIYLYSWWPLRRRGQIYEKMSQMDVEVRKKD